MKKNPGIVLAIVLLLVALCACACAALQSVTPETRAAAYAREAQGVTAMCKAYRFDRSVGLVGEVPEMARVCP